LIPIYGFANSLALKLAKVDDTTPDPTGGQFEHDPAGHLTGRVNERAMEAFNIKEDPSTLVTIPVERTMTGGKWVYES
jgi:hypothetical protein